MMAFAAAQPDRRTAESRAQRGGGAPAAPATLPFAWAGWRLTVPEQWRPLKIEGDWQRGLVILGDGEAPRMQVRWWRPSRRLDAERWLERQVRRWRCRAEPLTGAAALREAGFTHARWLPAARYRGGERPMWYGVAPDENLVIEAVLDPRAEAAKQRRLAQRVLATLAPATMQTGTLIAAYDVSFEVPEGYHALEHRLHLGDFIMRFGHRDGSQLTLRQVFPVTLALSRRSMAWWMRTWPFKTLRPFAPAGEEADCTIEAGDRILRGIQQRGRKRLRFPLGWIGPRRSLRMAVTDEQLDRLLIGEWDTRREPDAGALRVVILAMNRPMRRREACS